VSTAFGHLFDFCGLGGRDEILLTVLTAVLLLAAVSAPVWAWEFEMKGEYENRFRYFGRTGDTDLFGTVPLQDNTAAGGGAGTFIGFAGPTLYGTGNQAPRLADNSNQVLGGFLSITRGGFSRWGSDALYNDSKLTLRPVIRVNPAIRVHGVYNIGGMRNKYRQTSANANGDGLGAAPLERYYTSQTSMNAYDGTFGTWEQFRATVTLPWGVLSIGLKDFPLGLGTVLGENTRAEAILGVIPYGPFRFLPAVWLGRGRFLESWDTRPDGESKPEWFLGEFFTYDSGAMSAGGGFVWRSDHRGVGAGPSSTIAYGTSTAPFNVGASYQQPRDDTLFLGLGYFKFNNGRFFANAEYVWAAIDRYYPVANGAIAGGQLVGNPLASGSTFGGPATHIEANHFFAEAGVYGGPAKLSLMYALASGPVLNQASNAGGTFVGPSLSKRYFGFPINYQAMEPYEFLMFNTYAGGNNGGWAATDVTFVADEHGMLSDAYAFAGRLDYAVASNLNVYGSYIWAHRLERAGFIAGTSAAGPLNTATDLTHSGDTGNGAAGGLTVVDLTQLCYQINATNPVMAQYGGATPFVPDGFIGWEANAGVDWKLLEGMTFKARYSYWQPGEWFDFAYQNIGKLNGATVNSALVKGKSAINAFQASVLIEF